jgi:hypothetical protein
VEDGLDGLQESRRGVVPAARFAAYISIFPWGDRLPPFADENTGVGVLKICVEVVRAGRSAIQAGLLIVERQGWVRVTASDHWPEEPSQNRRKHGQKAFFGHFGRCSK